MASPGASAVSVTVMGSGTLLPDRDRCSAAHHVAAGSASVLLDCGSGTLHGLARHGIDWTALTHVAITHYHADHVGDLSALMFAMRNAPGAPRDAVLTLIGPPGFGMFLERAADVLGDHLVAPGRPARIVEVDDGRPFDDPERGVRLEACPTPHTHESMAYRIVSGDLAVGYTGDTGPSEDVSSFLEGCGVLLCACALMRSGERPGHLAPEDVARLAEVARPRILALTHIYPPMSPREAAERVRAAYHGRVVAARDGLRIDSRAEGWAVDPDEAEV